MENKMFDDVMRIAHASDQIADAIVNMKPAHRQHGIVKHNTWYDMRGIVDDIPGLGIVFTTSVGLTAGIQIPPKETGFTHLLLLPQFFRHEWNVRIVQTQAVLQHELAHIIVGDFEDAYGKLKPYTDEYFNHPAEITAYTHEAIACIASYGPSNQFSWTSGPTSPRDLLGNDASYFTRKVLDQYQPKAWKALTPQNKALIIGRLNKMHREAVASLDSAMTASADLKM
jgi:hypothetical protein